MDEKYQVMPPLSAEEYDALKADIAERGVQVPVEYDEDGNVLDGYHRVRACKELRLKDWPSVVRVGLTEEQKRTHARKLNLIRRHLMQVQKQELIRQQLLETPHLSDRQIAVDLNVSNSTVSLTRKDMVVSGQLCDSHSSVGADGKERPRQVERKAVAPASNAQPIPAKVEAEVGEATVPQQLIRQAAVFLPTNRTVAEIKQIANDADALRRVTTGKATVAQAVRHLKKVELGRTAHELAANPVPLPDGIFRVIEADPPWALDSNEGKSGGSQYSVMSTADIAAMGEDIMARAAEGCHLYLWAINPMLPEAFEVLKAWGFEYKTTLTWVKTNGFGTGHYFRGSTEHVLFGVRGRLDTLHNDQPTHFEAPRSRHSAKPDEFYVIAERMSPGPRLRLFARAQREGWASWGNQA